MTGSHPSRKRLLFSSCTLIACKCLVALTGFVAAVLIGVRFGTQPETDAFFVARTIPVSVLFGIAGALNLSFIPVYVRTLAADGPEAAQELAGEFFNLILWASVGATVVYVLTADWIVMLVAPGFSADARALTVTLTRIMAISIVAAGLYAVADSILNAEHRYVLSALGSLWLPAGALVGVVVLAGPWQIYGVAIGTLAGAVLQCLTVLPGVRGKMRWNRLGVSFADPRLRDVVKHLGISALIFGIWHVNETVDRIFASLCGGGAVSSLALGYTLVSMVPLLVAFPVYKVIYPAIVRLTMADDRQGLKQLFSWNFFLTAFLTFPATAVLVCVSVPITELVFHHGSFSQAAVDATAGVILNMSLGLWPSVVAVPMGFYLFVARRSDLILALAGAFVLLNVLLDYLFMRAMGLAGIALASSVLSAFRLGVLVVLVRGMIGGAGLAGAVLPAMRLAAATVLAGAVMCVVARWMPALIDAEGRMGRLLAVGGPIVVGAAVYLGLSLPLCSRQLHAFVALIKGGPILQEAG